MKLVFTSYSPTQKVILKKDYFKKIICFDKKILFINLSTPLTTNKALWHTATKFVPKAHLIIIVLD